MSKMRRTGMFNGRKTMVRPLSSPIPASCDNHSQPSNPPVLGSQWHLTPPEMEDGAAAKRWMDTDDTVPDTGIVNFYQTADTLMAHVDRAEYVFTFPSSRYQLANGSVCGGSQSIVLVCKEPC